MFLKRMSLLLDYEAKSMYFAKQDLPMPRPEIIFLEVLESFVRQEGFRKRSNRK